MGCSKNRIIISLFLISFSALFILSPASAKEKQNLEEILSGFDDDENPSLETVLEGFDEDTTNGETEDAAADEILEGFEDDIEIPEKDKIRKTTHLPDWLSVDGYVKMSTVYSFLPHGAAGTGTDWHGLTRLRNELKIELDADLSQNVQARISGHAFYDAAYAVNNRDHYTGNVLDNYEKELEFDEIYLQGRLTKNLDIKTGRQIVVWGRSDNIRVTDILNPLDLRWPGLVDIEKLRLPVTMTKFDIYLKDWSFSAITLHEIRYNKRSQFGSDFFPGTQPLPGKTSPDEGFDMDNTQFAVSVSGIFSGWDLSLYFADIYDPNAFISQTSSVPAPQFELKHSRIRMLGSAFSLAWGNWLFKAEAAFFDKLAFTNSPDTTYARLDALAGVEYSGISDATIALEMANRHYFGFEPRLKNSPDFQQKDLFEWALRVAKPFWNDTLNVTFLSTIFSLDGDDGGFQRLTAEYDVTDSIEVTGGIVFYQSGSLKRTMGIGDNDRVFFNIQYNF